MKGCPNKKCQLKDEIEIVFDFDSLKEVFKNGFTFYDFSKCRLVFFWKIYRDISVRLF